MENMWSYRKDQKGKEVLGMNILYLTWGYLHDKAIINAFEKEGVTITQLDIANYNLSSWKEQEEEKEALNLLLSNTIDSQSVEIVFSINFLSAISDFCQKNEVPYCSWVLEFPNFDLYTKSLFNLCNYIGINDSYLVEKFWKEGVEKVFFLPEAVERKERIQEHYEERELCFVGQQPVSKLNRESISKYSRGYLDAFLHAQRVLSGESILENGLINRVYDEISRKNVIPNKILPQFQKQFFADYYLAPECTIQQQNIILQNNANIMTIYSDNPFTICNCKKFSYPQDEEERRQIYAKKEFTLVLTPHVYHHGISRDMLEVVLAGGFPLCGLQKDYLYFFEKDESMAYFVDYPDFFKNLERYGNDERERKRLQKNMYEMVVKNHTYKNRIVTMLETWANL